MCCALSVIMNREAVFRIFRVVLVEVIGIYSRKWADFVNTGLGIGLIVRELIRFYRIRVNPTEADPQVV